jgi:hypothetical protein
MCVDVIAAGNHFVFDFATGLILTAARFAVAVLASQGLGGHSQRAEPRCDRPEPRLMASTSLSYTSALTKEAST